MKLLFNADDFGLSKGVNFGIIESFENGVVRSATMMAGMPGFDHAVALAKQHPALGVGVHLTLTTGNSVGGVYPTLTDAEEHFFKQADWFDRYHAGQIDFEEVASEYEAQIQKCLAAGLAIDHLDSHHHLHFLDGMLEVAMRLAQKYGLPLRMQDRSKLAGPYTGLVSTDAFSDRFYGEEASIATLQQLLRAGGADSLEIMCHPAYVDAGLYEATSYNVKRIFELETLTGRPLEQLLAVHGAELINYRDLS